MAACTLSQALCGCESAIEIDWILLEAEKLSALYISDHTVIATFSTSKKAHLNISSTSITSSPAFS